MGLFDFLANEFIDIIEWTDDSNDTLLYRFEREDHAIKQGAKLIVREGQQVLFLNEGALKAHFDTEALEFADSFGPGTHTLETRNLPILGRLQGWKYGFESPFKADVLFVSTRIFADQKWGTPNPIMLRDADFGMVRLRAFGSYAFRIGEPQQFLRQVVGTDGHFTTDEIAGELRNLIITRFTDALGESRIPALDLAANYNEFGDFLTTHLAPEFANYGLELTGFRIGNISLPEQVTEALDRRSSMGALGNLDQYLKYQTAEAIGQAGSQPGGGGQGFALGSGLAMAERVNQVFQPSPSTPAPVPAPTPGGMAPPPPPPPPATPSYHLARNGQTQGPFNLEQLRQMVAQGHLTPDIMVWTNGMAGWARAGDQNDLRPLFAQVPPPPPPA
ncbi:SPFH domain-containing protein [Rhabdochromatium marinum]|uniref:SPFH domain-containing protein n=1 Tax=Rhabdochromatium marinum TaxID=48729 RepID=UPI0019060C0A|nr:SPFH domain-containing protein [Rhabdochromatium marinum]MBK1648572.1 antifreeze protein [Rhabdochromatium marinum]